MAKKVDRVIIDTNLWIAFLITKDFKQLDKQIKSGALKLLFSLELIEEFLSVTDRPKFKKYFSRNNVDELIQLFDVYGEIIDVKSNVSVCRDPKDNFLLSLAKDGQCNYLITGDNDLLELRRFGRTLIVSISEYLLKFDKK